MSSTAQNKETICLVAILKDEEKFLDEWLVYHKMIGIDFFFLYDDDPVSTLKDFLQPHAEYARVIEWAKENPSFKRIGNQLSAYRHAVKNYAINYDWVIFIDADEFIVLKKHTDIKDFLLGFKDAAAISLHWYLYGHNGFISDPPGPVITHLNKRMRQASPEVKSITRTNAISGFSSPHYCDLKYGSRLDDNGNVFSEVFYRSKSSVARINHYKCRSFNNWMNRVKRGDVNFNEFNKPQEHLWRLNNDLCFNEFVSDVAASYNEVADNYMLAYKYDVYDEMLRIRHKRDNVLKEPQYEAIIYSLNRQLDKVAESLNIKFYDNNASCHYADSIKLCLFWFVYSKYKKSAHYFDLANSTLTELIKNSGKLTSDDNHLDLIELGWTIEYLVQNRLLNINTFGFLADVDFVLIHWIENKLLNNTNELALIARYFLLRLRSALNDPASVKANNYHSKSKKNKSILNQVFSQLYLTIDSQSIQKKVGIMLILCESFDYLDDERKKNIFDFIEKLKHEINNNSARLPNHVLMQFSLVCLKFFQLSKLISYQITAMHYINQVCTKNAITWLDYVEISKFNHQEKQDTVLKNMDRYWDNLFSSNNYEIVVEEETKDVELALYLLASLRAMGPDGYFFFNSYSLIIK